MDKTAVYKMMKKLQNPESADWSTDLITSREPGNGMPLQPSLGGGQQPTPSAISSFAQQQDQMSGIPEQMSSSLPQTPQRAPTSLDIMLDKYRASKNKRLGATQTLSNGRGGLSGKPL